MPFEDIFRNTEPKVYETVFQTDLHAMKGTNTQPEELKEYVNYIDACNEETLLHAITKVDRCASWKEPLLYTASRLGHEGLVSTLLRAELRDKIDINVRESLRGWTPLIVASIEGHLSIVELLVAAGADQLILDLSGWSAKEHAAFRGHLKHAALLQTPENSNPLRSHCVASSVDKIPTPKAAIFEDENRSNDGNASHILVTLGSPNTREKVNAVDLFTRQDDLARSIAPLSSCVLNIQAVGTDVLTEKSKNVQLPILEDMINRPWHFVVKEPEQLRLVFTVIQPGTRDVSDEDTIGNGVFLLTSLRHGLAASREGLARYHTVPILAKKSLEYMGTVTFGLVVVTPAPRAPSISSLAKRGFCNENGTEVVGHRGSGANSAAHTNLELGENTLQSFTSAAALGASAVEFDVQLTKDLVPVIYHDFLVMEAGGDNPIYTLRLNQFVHLSEAQQIKGDLCAMAEKRYLQRTKDENAPAVKQRSLSLSVYDNSPTTDLIDRMRHTEAAMEGAHKGNLTGESIHGVFPTFEDLFTHLPESVAFNVEMKYPTLWEAEDRNMDRYAPEINTYVNLVLEIIYRQGGNRSITFSSFSPEVCILLSLKQQDYPVLFLSKAGSIPVGDVRCSGLQQSIHFAKRWNLAGIVILSQPLVWCPRLIGYAKSAGLKVCSYGPLNNDPESAKIQAEAGLDVIIVDKVRLISETLKGLR